MFKYRYIIECYSDYDIDPGDLEDMLLEDGLYDVHDNEAYLHNCRVVKQYITPPQQPKGKWYTEEEIRDLIARATNQTPFTVDTGEPPQLKPFITFEDDE